MNSNAKGRIPVGTTVVALRRLPDTGPDGEVYVHAEVGDTGVVEGYYWPAGHGAGNHYPIEGDDYPTIDWGAGSGKGFFDCWLGTDIDIAEDQQK